MFHRNEGGSDQWGHVWMLTAADKADQDWFGSGVSVSGNVIAVGASGAGSVEEGAIYIFDDQAGKADGQRRT